MLSCGGNIVRRAQAPAVPTLRRRNHASQNGPRAHGHAGRAYRQAACDDARPSFTQRSDAGVSDGDWLSNAGRSSGRQRGDEPGVQPRTSRPALCPAGPALRWGRWSPRQCTPDRTPSAARRTAPTTPSARRQSRFSLARPTRCPPGLRATTSTSATAEPEPPTPATGLRPRRPGSSCRRRSLPARRPPA